MNKREAFFSIVGCCFCCQHLFAQVFPTGALARQVGAVARGCGNSSDSIGKTVRVANSGVAELDAKISLELDFLRKLFRVSPAFYFGRDDPEKPVAHTFRDPDDQAKATVILGVSFIQREIRLNPNFWQIAIMGVLAHEWTHAFQYEASLQDGQFIWETHADFMSGWYLGVKKATGLLQIDPAPLANSLFTKGERSDFFNPDNYGSAQVRIAAMLEGYSVGLNGQKGSRLDVFDAANLGYLHAQRVAAR